MKHYAQRIGAAFTGAIGALLVIVACANAAEYLHLAEAQKSLQGIPTAWNPSPDDDISAHQAALRRQGFKISTTWKWDGYDRINNYYICPKILMWAQWPSGVWQWVGEDFRSYRAADGKKINDAVGCGGGDV